MILYVNEDTGNVSLNNYERNHVDALDLKRGPIPIALQFLRGGIPRVEAKFNNIEFGLKESGKFDEDAVALLTITDGAPSTVDGFYEGILDGDTEAVRALFFANGDPDDDLATIPLMAEVTWRETTIVPKNRAKTIGVTFANAVLSDEETAVASAPIRLIVHDPAMTAYVGGTDALDGVVTTGLSVGVVYSFLPTGGLLEFWRLTAGTTAEDVSAGIVRPNDYDGTTNAKVWVRLLRPVRPLNYQGTWNATTNVPAIPAASAANRGDYYVVATAGTTTISGINSWAVGDWIVSNGSTWDKLDNTDQVTSVAGRTGAVTLTQADIPGLKWRRMSVSFTAIAGDRVQLDTDSSESVGQIVVTLPAAPADGDTVELVPNVATGSTWPENTPAVVGNGHNVGGTSTMDLDVNARVLLMFNSDVNAWNVYAS